MNKILEFIKKNYNILLSKRYYTYLFAVILFLIFLFFTINKYNSFYKSWEIGDIAPYDMKLTKDMDITDRFQTENLIQKTKQETTPVFVKDGFIHRRVKEELKKYFSTIREIQANIDITKKQKIKNIISVKSNIIAGNISLMLNRSFLDKIEKEVFYLLDVIYSKGVMIESNLFGGKKLLSIDLWNSTNNTFIKNVSFDFYTINKINYDDILKKKYKNITKKEIECVSNILDVFLLPDVYYDVERTAKKVQQRLKSVTPVFRHLKKGMVIIRSGEEITPEKKDILIQIQKQQSRSFFITFLYIFIFYIAWFYLVYIEISYFEDKILKKNKYYFILFYFSLFYFFLNIYISNLEILLNNTIPVSIFVPIVIAGILLPVFFNLYFSFLYVGMLTVLSGVIFQGDFINFIFVFFIGLISVYLSNKIKKRNKFWMLGFYIILVNSILIIIPVFFNNLYFKDFLISLYWSTLNVIISSIIALGTITIFESIFSVPTDYKLLELSDLNKKIFKDMLLNAPGTYHHSILVANLAEAAAREIDANPLLVKVAAYYHDIGKLEYADYYTENQMYQNKMEKVSPNLSVSLVKAHLKNGIEKAKELKLPDEVIDLIAQHHGKSVIKFFYFKALKLASENKTKIFKEDFMYPGENPQTREAVILLLADSVEAASRSLKNPTVSNIQNLVEEVINAKLVEGVLDDSEITLAEIHKIGHAFVRILLGVFHTRVQYPNDSEIKKEENKNGGKKND